MYQINVVENKSSENSELNFLGKKIEVDSSGNLVKTSRAYLLKGTARNVAIANLEELGKIIRELRSSQALILGTYHQAKNDDEFWIGSREIAEGNRDRPVVTRTKSNFAFLKRPTVVLLDFDEHPDHIFRHGITAKGFRRILIAIMPIFQKIEMLIVPSSSSNIYKTDEEAPKYSNKHKRLHIYIIIDDGTKIDDLFERLEYVSWSNELGYHKISSNGALLKRHLFDSAVASPERLVFESKPLLGDGLSQIERQIYHFEGGVLNSASLALSTDEKSELNTWINKDKNDSYYLPFIADKKKAYHLNIVENYVKAGLSEVDARGYADQILDSTYILPSVAKLKSENGKIVSVQDVIDHFDAYEDLSFVDPLQTYESNEFRAKIFKNHKGGFVMHSFRHGGTHYFLKSTNTFSNLFNDKHPACIEKMLQSNTKQHAMSIKNSVEILACYVKSRPEIDDQILLSTLIANATSHHKSNVDIRDLYTTATKHGDTPEFDCKSLSSFSTKLMCRHCPLFKSKMNDYVVVDIEERIPDFEMRCPDIHVSGNQIAVSSTIENLNFLLSQYTIECQYDVVLKKANILIDGHVAHDDLSDETKVHHIESLCNKNNMRNTTANFLVNIFAKNPINPVMQWIESVQWDGVTRMDDLMGSLILEDSNHANYAQQMITTWLIQCIAALDAGERTPNQGAIKKYELVLVFTGAQGVGKTSWFKSLTPQHLKDYFSEGEQLILNDKDSVKRCISHWIVELGEIDTTFRKSDISQLKAFLSKTQDEIRLPYAKKASKFKRQTSFCGSVNELNFLHDETGNRRFLPVHVKQCKTHHIDLQQLWAEILQLYLNGATWWLSDNAKVELEAIQAAYRSVSVIEEQLNDYFDLGQSHVRQTFSKFFSATEALKAAGVALPTTPNVSLAKKIFASYHINGVKNSKFGYWLVIRGNR